VFPATNAAVLINPVRLKRRTNMSQHTPGPWTVEPYDNTDLCGIYRVWEVQRRLVGEDEQAIQREELANARLIAAAPELLAALERIESAVRSGDMRSLVVSLQGIVRAAIAKARGGAR
jgi:hypothetical protein